MKTSGPRLPSRTPTLFTLLALITLMACGGNTITGTPPTVTNSGLTNSITTVRGNLTFVATDSLSAPGFLFALPSVDVGPQRIIVKNMRYGSLCLYDVQGAATQSGRHIAIDVTFTERLTSCTAEIRALRYTATLTGLSGAYDVDVIHHEDGRADTLRHVSVVVP